MNGTLYAWWRWVLARDVALCERCGLRIEGPVVARLCAVCREDLERRP